MEIEVDRYLVVALIKRESYLDISGYGTSVVQAAVIR
jgi:hypothetical protein